MLENDRFFAMLRMTFAHVLPLIDTRLRGNDVFSHFKRNSIIQLKIIKISVFLSALSAPLWLIPTAQFAHACDQLRQHFAGRSIQADIRYRAGQSRGLFVYFNHGGTGLLGQ